VDIDSCPARRAGLLAAVLASLALGGCAAGGFNLSKADVDPTILTGAVGDAAPGTTSPEQLSDEATIRDAVSSADVESLKGAPIPWANADTGARGAISSVVEDKSAGVLCRRFITSRESFDGVALYNGQACMVAPGTWRMERFGAS
jgi:hypothetical protein